MRGILTKSGFKVEGPGYTTAWFDGRIQVIHKDYFDVGDLISFKDGRFILHQVTDLSHKAAHEKIIDSEGLPCILWCKTQDRERRWRTFSAGREIDPREIVDSGAS